MFAVCELQQTAINAWDAGHDPLERNRRGVTLGVTCPWSKLYFWSHLFWTDIFDCQDIRANMMPTYSGNCGKFLEYGSYYVLTP